LAGFAGSAVSTKRSWTSGPVFVTPHAIRALWPRITPGALANETPATSYGQAAETTRQWSAFMYQMLGICTPRWGSLARSAFPVALFAGPTTQLFEPTPGCPSAVSPASKPARAPISSPIFARRAKPAASRSSIAVRVVAVAGAVGAGPAAAAGARRRSAVVVIVGASVG
jgi:hypothetical protein